MQTKLRHRLEYAAYLGFKGAVRLFPHPWARPFGAALGVVLHRLDRHHRRIVRENLDRAFPDWDAGRRRRVAAACFRHFGAMLADSISASRFTPEAFERRIVVEGWDNLDRARDLGRGVLLISAHIGNWEMAAHPVSMQREPMHVVGRPLNNPLVDRRLRRERARFGHIQIDKQGAALKISRAIRRGGMVGVVIDQRVRPRQGICIPFLGHDAWTTSIPALVALRHDTPAVPIFGYPEPGGRYRVFLREAVSCEDLPRGAEGIERLTRRYVAVIEAEIRRHPEQWLWLHERWRPR